MRKMFILPIFLALTACGGEFADGWDDHKYRIVHNLNIPRQMFGKATPMNMPKPPQTGIPAYDLGWNDGCATGLSAQGSNTSQIVYEFYQNPKYVTDNTYTKVWRDAFQTCRYYQFSTFSRLY
jgi:hypothetical protein